MLARLQNAILWAISLERIPMRLGIRRNKPTQAGIIPPTGHMKSCWESGPLRPRRRQGSRTAYLAYRLADHGLTSPRAGVVVGPEKKRLNGFFTAETCPTCNVRIPMKMTADSGGSWPRIPIEDDR